MMIFYKARLVYLAVPKTGTTAIQEAFEASASIVFRAPPGMKHVNARQYWRKFRPLFDKDPDQPMETMAVMREPVDWLRSWYRYRQRPFLNGKPNSTRDLTFAEFIEAYISDAPPSFAKVGSQATFLCEGDGPLLVDHLFRHDQIEDVVAFLNKRLNSKQTLNVVNASPRAAADSIALPDDLLEALKQTHARDFALYNQIADR